MQVRAIPSREMMALKTASISFLILVGMWLPCFPAEPARPADDPDAHWWGFGNWCWPLDACTREDRGLNNDVAALAVFGGELIAGGAFGAAGSVLLDQIGRWDGHEWHQLGGGIDHLDCPGLACFGSVQALMVYNGDLIVGGRFWTVDDKRVRANYIARWDGEAWHALGLGMDGDVRALIEYEGKLVAGGSFTHAEGRPVNRIAIWDGNLWRSLGGGVSWPAGGEAGVQEFALFDGHLVVVGSFGQAGGVPVNNIALWDGATWHPLGEGSAVISWAVTTYNGNLYAGGRFRSNDGTTIWGLGRWDGTSWHPTGTNYLATGFIEYNDALVHGGSPEGLRRWNGTSWLPFGSGVEGDEDGTRVSCFAVLGTSLFVGGRFILAGGKPSANIARWDDVITPVAVQDLQAQATMQGVTLSWHLPSWWELQGILVERAESAQGPYRRRTDSPLLPEEFMTYVDGDVTPAADYWYRLVLLSANGAEVAAAPIRVTVPGTLETALLPPLIGAGRSIQVRYRIGEPATRTVLRAYDVRGQLVRSLAEGMREPGEYSRMWDGRTDSGISVARGVYVIRLQAGRFVASRKVVLAGD